MSGWQIAPIWRVLSWTVIISAPALAVLGVLAWLERIPAWESAVAGVVVYGLTTALSFTLLRDFEKLIRYAEQLNDDPTAKPPRIDQSEAARRLANALTTLHKSWQEHRHTVASLARSRAAILDSLPDPLLLIDQDRILNGANQAAVEVFGREITGGELATVIRDPNVLDATDQALKTGEGGYVQFSLSKPVERSFGCLIGVLPDGSSDGTSVILQLHDMTEHVKMDRMRADFVANASHELRTPLSSLLGFIETLRGPAKDDTEARNAFLDIMLKQATLMTRLIDDLLSLSRIELKEHARPTEAIDVVVVMQTTCELLDMQASESNVTLDITLPESVPPAMGDPDELGQVFHNLIVNAIKYGGRGKSVDISISISDSGPQGVSDGPWVMVSVRDYGEGIAREHIPRLTERFYRVDTARSRELGGTGLGLAIVKHITKRHRGHLIIDSEEGEGSTFTVYLPIAKETKQPAPSAAQQATAA